MIYLFYGFVLLIFPILLVGLTNRTKALWAGRKGFPLLQLGYDLLRLLRKDPVYSVSTSWIFQMSAVVFFTTTIVAGLVSPVVPGISLLSFPYDFVFFAYLLALGRIFLILGSLDTASSFEGMGASREATYSALIEPALFIVFGTLCHLKGASTLNSIVALGSDFHNNGMVIVLCVITLFILIQTELSRVPVDDPNTHLELTMIHEAMVLDHSACDLALIQYASAIKLTILSGVIASLLNPFSISTEPTLAAGLSLSIMMGVSVSIGLVESLIARVKMRTIPLYLGVALASSVLALIFTFLEKWSRG